MTFPSFLQETVIVWLISFIVVYLQLSIDLCMFIHIFFSCGLMTSNVVQVITSLTHRLADGILRRWMWVIVSSCKSRIFHLSPAQFKVSFFFVNQRRASPIEYERLYYGRRQLFHRVSFDRVFVDELHLLCTCYPRFSKEWKRFYILSDALFFTTKNSMPDTMVRC